MSSEAWLHDLRKKCCGLWDTSNRIICLSNKSYWWKCLLICLILKMVIVFFLIYREHLMVRLRLDSVWATWAFFGLSWKDELSLWGVHGIWWSRIRRRGDLENRTHQKVVTTVPTLRRVCRSCQKVHWSDWCRRCVEGQTVTELARVCSVLPLLVVMLVWLQHLGKWISSDSQEKLPYIFSEFRTFSSYVIDLNQALISCEADEKWEELGLIIPSSYGV